MRNPPSAVSSRLTVRSRRSLGAAAITAPVTLLEREKTTRRPGCPGRLVALLLSSLCSPTHGPCCPSSRCHHHRWARPTSRYAPPASPARDSGASYIPPSELEDRSPGLPMTEQRQACYAIVGYRKLCAFLRRAVWARPRCCAAATTSLGASVFS